MRTLNILVAEDDDQNQALMKLILDRQGHNVKSAWNGNAALEAVKSGDFDLVFMDVQMPEMDGLEVTRQIRLWENNKKHIPIVMLTGSVPQNISEEYKNAGADTFILKPFDVKRISLLVDIIAGDSENAFPTESRPSLAGSLAEIPLLDFKNAILRFNRDTIFYLENLQEFIHSLPTRQENMTQAMKTRNWRDLASNAHNLSGVSANFGANQLSLLASSLDEYCQHRKIRLIQKTFHEIILNMDTLTKMANNIIEQKRSQNSDHQSGGQ